MKPSAVCGQCVFLFSLSQVDVSGLCLNRAAFGTFAAPPSTAAVGGFWVYNLERLPDQVFEGKHLQGTVSGI